MLFIGITALIVLFGVEKGIEKVSKIMMPVLVVLTLVIAIYAVCLPGALEGVNMIKDLNFVTPESEGIPSERIVEFIEYLREVRANVHSFIIARHGNIIAEGYYKPFDKDTITITTDEANKWTVAMTVVMPAVFGLCGLIVITRRKHS